MMGIRMTRPAMSLLRRMGGRRGGAFLGPAAGGFTPTRRAGVAATSYPPASSATRGRPSARADPDPPSASSRARRRTRGGRPRGRPREFDAALGYWQKADPDL